MCVHVCVVYTCVCYVYMCITMCSVHICGMCMCLYICEEYGITPSPNCAGLSRSCQMASSSGVHLEPGLYGSLGEAPNIPGVLAIFNTVLLSCECLVIAPTHLRPCQSVCTSPGGRTLLDCSGLLGASRPSGTLHCFPPAISDEIWMLEGSSLLPLSSSRQPGAQGLLGMYATNICQSPCWPKFLLGFNKRRQTPILTGVARSVLFCLGGI